MVIFQLPMLTLLPLEMLCAEHSVLYSKIDEAVLTRQILWAAPVVVTLTLF